MSKDLRLSLVIALACSLVLPGCSKEKSGNEDSFKFITYPGARYLPHLTEMTKRAHKLLRPNQEPPTVVIYDTWASVDDVANFYVKAYGYSGIAPDATNNLSAAKPPAYYRTGDLQTDAKAIEGLLPKLNLRTDISPAVGAYTAVEITSTSNRPRVTVQHPYFDVTTSQVVPRTLILMSR